MKTLEDLLSDVTNDAARRKRVIAGIVDYYDTIIAKLPECSETCYVWADPSDINVSMTGNAEALTKFFRLMRANGFEPESRPTEKTPNYRSRFKNADQISFYLAFSSTVCRRVKVGTRTEEVPIYETVCDDAPATLPDGADLTADIAF